MDLPETDEPEPSESKQGRKKRSALEDDDDGDVE